MEISLVLKRVFMRGFLCFELPKDPAALAELKHLLILCKEKHGDYLRVKLKPPYKPRTTGRNSQNAAIHGYCSQIAEELGESADFIKIYCKELAVSRGYPCERDADGNIKISKLTDRPIPVSTTEIDTQEAGILIDVIIELAAEHGIILRND